MILIPTTHTHTDSDGEKTVTDLTVDWNIVRSVRLEELSKSDWRAAKDRTMYQNWKDYRQFLRDLPQTYDDARDAAEALNAYDKPEDRE